MYQIINIVIVLHIHKVSSAGIANICIVKEKAKELNFISYPFSKEPSHVLPCLEYFLAWPKSEE